MQRIKRRRVLQAIGFVSGLVLTKGCSSSNSGTNEATAQDSASVSEAIGADTCVLFPEQTEGPYYLDLNLLRKDITEGKAGVPLRLALQVVEFPGCTAIANAAVDIWHCDALGAYAISEGTTFLRGTQVTDAGGRVEFLTLYPGWYRGRTTHIHLKVHLDSETVLTSQLYFPDEITQAVYAREPYNSRPNQDTTNASDRILSSSGNANTVQLKLTEAGEGYVGSLTIGVQRA